MYQLDITKLKLRYIVDLIWLWSYSMEGTSTLFELNSYIIICVKKKLKKKQENKQR